jgi:hypothetical protein
MGMDEVWTLVLQLLVVAFARLLARRMRLRPRNMEMWLLKVMLCNMYLDV